MRPPFRIFCTIGTVVFLYFVLPATGVDAHHCGDFRDCFSTLRAAVSATLGLSMFGVLLSIGLDLTPGVGTVKGLIEAVTGKDLITGEELQTHERVLGILGPAGRIFGIGGSLARGSRHIDTFGEISGSASRWSSSVDTGARSTRGTRAFDEVRSATAGGRPLYGVDPSLRAADEAAGLLRNDAYIRNPTARNLNDLLTETGRIGSKQMSGRFMYVVDQHGNIIIGTRAGQRMPHPTLIGGVNPQVQAAGIVDIRGGRIYAVDNVSGHFKPGPESLQAAQEAFGRLPERVFHRNFQGYLPFQ